MRPILAAVPVLLCCAAIGQAGEAEDPGKALYVRYCGACHGPAGKGDGLAGTFMRPKPADLTQLAKKSGGEFPFQRTVQAIDGTTPIGPHGHSEMPVWGEVFAEKATGATGKRAEVQAKIMSITAYLRSIQEK